MNAPQPNTSVVRRLVCVALAIAPASSVAESINPAGLPASDERLIRELETESWVAWKDHDASFFERFLSDDHLDVHANGIVGKSAVVDAVRNSVCVVQSYSIGPLSFTSVSTDVVLVTYRAQQDTSCGGVKVPSPVWATSLYARRAGRWVNVLYQHTPVART